MAYDAFKTIHIIGVVVLLGNVTITAFWKVFADMTRNPVVIAHAQRGVTVSDWLFTLLGIVLIVIGGFGAALVGGIPIFEPGWLLTGEILFVISGLIWVFKLIPIQVRQARQARDFEKLAAIPTGYWEESRSWIIWGVLATVPLVVAIYVMIAK